MTDDTIDGTVDLEGDIAVGAMLDSATEDFAQQIANSVESFLLALRAIAEENDVGSAIPLLLLEITQISLAGARLGVQTDFTPRDEYQPDVGPEADLEDLRLRLAEMLDPIDTYSYVFDPYVPGAVESQLSDDITAIASDLENGLRHYRCGRRRRGPVVVAVLLRRLVGQPRGRRAQRAAVGRLPQPPRRGVHGRRRGPRRGR